MNILSTQQHKQNNYLGVFVALAALTALEVGVTYLPVPKILVLLPLALAKASLVAMYFMHLKNDLPIYRYIFLFGILMGVILIISLILMYGPNLLD